MFYKMWKLECNLESFKLNYYPSEAFTTSCVQKTERVLPAWIVYRATTFLLFFVGYIYTLVYSFFENRGYDRFKHLIFLTNWTFIVQTVQFGMALVLVVNRYRREAKTSPALPMEKTPKAYQVYWALFTISLSSSVVVSVIFWLFVYDADLIPANTPNLILHAFNSIFTLIDFALVSQPVRFLHFYWPAFYALLYLMFNITYQLSGGTGSKGMIPVYKILDWRYPDKAVLTSVMSCFFLLTVHFLFALLSVFKFWLKKRARPGSQA